MTTAGIVYIPRVLSGRVPVYHERGAWLSPVLANGVQGDELRTICGLLVYRYVAGDNAPRLAETRLRRDHAEAIGRPCGRCRRVRDAWR